MQGHLEVGGGRGSINKAGRQQLLCGAEQFADMYVQLGRRVERSQEVQVVPGAGGEVSRRQPGQTGGTREETRM